MNMGSKSRSTPHEVGEQIKTGVPVAFSKRMENRSGPSEDRRFERDSIVTRGATSAGYAPLRHARVQVSQQNLLNPPEHAPSCSRNRKKKELNYRCFFIGANPI